MHRLNEFNQHSAWKRQALIFVLDILLIWQTAAKAGRHFIALPLPVRIGMINFIVLAGILTLTPVPSQLPAVAIPILWGGAYAITLTIALLSPARPARQVFIHWVN
jgi:hypothetical protein